MSVIKKIDIMLNDFKNNNPRHYAAIEDLMPYLRGQKIWRASTTDHMFYLIQGLPQVGKTNIQQLVKSCLLILGYPVCKITKKSIALCRQDHERFVKMQAKYNRGAELI